MPERPGAAEGAIGPSAGEDERDPGGADPARRVAHGLTLEIDRDLCVGFGDCIGEAPEAFELDGDGIAVFTGPEAVPRWRLLDACAACPVDAITVRDADGERIVP